MFDYLIIGSGLAGISFAEVALKNNKKIFVIDDASQNSSMIAGGLYNPVILKRFTQVWKAQEQLFFMNDFYKNLEKKLQKKFNYEMPIFRKLFSVEEQNNWFVASDKLTLQPFLNPTLNHKKYNFVDAPFGYGEVYYTGYLKTNLLCISYKEWLINQGVFKNEKFEYEKLQITNQIICYKEIKAKHIIFAEGFGLNKNPFFNYLPLDGTKGELLIIKALNLNLDSILNTSIFILPLGDNLFKVGATYDWKDKTNIPTEVRKLELKEKLKEIITCKFEIVSHHAGVRPTVRDRKPLVGTHPKFDRVHILNGLGTRGVMIGPWAANELLNFIENQTVFDDEMNINRFLKKIKN